MKLTSAIHRNDRNVRNTPFQFLPSRIEQASIETYAVNTRSIPPGGKSMLDTLGATVAFVVSDPSRSKKCSALHPFPCLCSPFSNL